MTLRVLLADDEPLARERLRSLLRRSPDVEIVAECGSGREAADAIRRERPDLVFLDIQMPEMDGFGVIRDVGTEKMPPVVFVTAYDRYAVRAFEVHALDYLLKPFDRERFGEALRRARAAIEAGSAGGGTALAERLLALLEERAAEGPGRIAVRDGSRVIPVLVSEVDWIGAAGNYVELHLGGRTILHRETMNGIEERLDAGSFLRIHRSTIVNIDRIRELRPLFHGEYQVLLADGTRLTLSRGYRDRVLGVLGDRG